MPMFNYKMVAPPSGTWVITFSTSVIHHPNLLFPLASLTSRKIQAGLADGNINCLEMIYDICDYMDKSTQRLHAQVERSDFVIDIQ